MREKKCIHLYTYTKWNETRQLRRDFKMMNYDGKNDDNQIYSAYENENENGRGDKKETRI